MAMYYQLAAELAVELAKHVCAPTANKYWTAVEVEEFIEAVAEKIHSIAEKD